MANRRALVLDNGEGRQLPSGDGIVTDSIIGPSDGTGIVIGEAGGSASTGSALQLQTYTTTQRDNLVAAAGMLVYNSTTGTVEGYDGTSWNDALGGGGGGTLDSAYDGGGSGAGRTITVDSGSVALNNGQTTGTIQDIAGGTVTLTGDLVGLDVDFSNVTPSGNATIGVRVQNGIITCPDTGTNSERFGLDSSATGNVTLAAGYMARATDQECTAVGAQTNARRPRTTIIGEGGRGPSDAGSADAIIVGANNSLDGSSINNIGLFGNSIDLNEGNWSNSFIFSWGFQERGEHVANSFIIGSDANPITTLYLGHGHRTETDPATEAQVVASTYNRALDNSTAPSIALVGGAHFTGNTTLTDVTAGDVRIQGGPINTAGSNLTRNAGSVLIAGGDLDTQQADVNNAGSVTLRGGLAADATTSNFNGDVIIQNPSGSLDLLSASATLTLLGPNDGTGIVVGRAGATASSGAALQVQSFTSSERDNLTATAGMLVYNSTSGTIEGYDGTSWNDALSAGGGGGSDPSDNDWDTTGVATNELAYIDGTLSVGQAIADGFLGGTEQVVGVVTGSGVVSYNGRVQIKVEAAAQPTAGTRLYLSASTAGQATPTAPSSNGEFRVFIGWVADSSSWVSSGDPVEVVRGYEPITEVVT